MAEIKPPSHRAIRTPHRHPLASYIPLSINGQRADPTGNIILSKGQLADNAAAKAAGLALNDIYHTAGVLKIVI